MAKMQCSIDDITKRLSTLGISDWHEVASIVAHAAPGASFRFHYAFGSWESVYTVELKNNKKILRHSGDNRGRIITGPASVARIIGKPCRSELISSGITK